MRLFISITALCMLALPVVAQVREPADALSQPAAAPPRRGGFGPDFRADHPLPAHSPRGARTTDWQGNLSLSLGAGLVYELGDWPSAVLFGSARTEAAPGVAVVMGIQYGLLAILSLNVEVALRCLYFGDIAADDSPATPFAENVSVVSPSVALTARLRPASRMYLGAGLGIGFGRLFGEAITTRDGVMLPFGDTSGAVGELRGEVGFLLGPRSMWDVGARLRFVGYPRVAGTSTLAVALELALTVPVWQ